MVNLKTYRRSASAHLLPFMASFPFTRILLLPPVAMAGILHFCGTRSSDCSSHTMSLTWSTRTEYEPSVAHLKNGSFTAQTRPSHSISFPGTICCLGW